MLILSFMKLNEILMSVMWKNISLLQVFFLGQVYFKELNGIKCKFSHFLKYSLKEYNILEIDLITKSNKCPFLCQASCWLLVTKQSLLYICNMIFPSVFVFPLCVPSVCSHCVFPVRVPRVWVGEETEFHWQLQVKKGASSVWCEVSPETGPRVMWGQPGEL